MPSITPGLAKAIETVLAEYHPPSSTIPGPLADLRREYSAAMFGPASHLSIQELEDSRREQIKADRDHYDATHLCYMGHPDCYDLHTRERLADEADWEAELDDDLGY